MAFKSSKSNGKNPKRSTARKAAVTRKTSKRSIANGVNALLPTAEKFLKSMEPRVRKEMKTPASIAYIEDFKKGAFSFQHLTKIIIGLIQRTTGVKMDFKMVFEYKLIEDGVPCYGVYDCRTNAIHISQFNCSTPRLARDVIFHEIAHYFQNIDHGMDVEEHGKEFFVALEWLASFFPTLNLDMLGKTRCRVRSKPYKRKPKSHKLPSYVVNKGISRYVNGEKIVEAE